MRETLFSILLLSFIGSSLCFAQDPVGQVENLAGRADAKRGEQAARPLAEGDVIYRADLVRTKSDAHLDIHLLDGSVLSLDENTRLAVAEYVIDEQPSGFFNLLQGRVRSSVTNTFSERRNSFQMRTTTALMGVQGTDFLVTAAAVETNVSVFEGVVQVSNVDPDIVGSLLLSAGQSAQILLGAPPETPTEAALPEPQAQAQAQEKNLIGSGGQLDIRADGRQAGDPTQSLPSIMPTIITPAIPNLPGRPNR